MVTGYAQLKELVDNYDPAILWFDGEWSTDRPNNPWTDRDGERLEACVRSLSPDIVINNRVGKRRVVDGDTGTPEQEIPAEPFAGQLWESCMTLNGSWGFARWDTNWKSPADLTRNLAGIAGRGGNYLLNVGPVRTGRIPAESVTRLRSMGDWLRVNGRAVYGAHEPGIVAEPDWGAVSRNGDKLHASVYDWSSSLTLRALAPFAVAGARVLGSDQRVGVRRDGDVVTITPSGGPANDIATVVELTVRPQRPAGPARGTGLTARFWPNASFTGEPTVTRTDATVNYNWKYTGSPDPAIPAEPFAGRWTGRVEAPYTGTYTFTTVSDDTVRLWVDGRLIVDNTTPHGPGDRPRHHRAAGRAALRRPAGADRAGRRGVDEADLVEPGPRPAGRPGRPPLPGLECSTDETMGALPCGSCEWAPPAPSVRWCSTTRTRPTR